MKNWHQINILCGTVTGATAVDSGARVTLDTAQYSGTCQFFFEAVYSGAASNTGTIRLRRFGTTTDDATLTGRTHAFLLRSRSAAFTPPAGATDYVVRNNTDGTRSQTIKAARILISQDTGVSNLTSVETQIEIGNQELAKTNTAAAVLSAIKYFLFESASWDGTLACFAEATWKTSSTNTCTITLQEASSITGTWTDKVTIVNAASSTTVQKTRVSFTPTNGMYYRLSLRTSANNYDTYNAKIIIRQTGTDITKFQSEALIANTILSGNALQQYFWQRFDPADWNGSTLTVRHLTNSSNSNTAQLEMQADQNLAPFSSDVLNGTWTRTNVTATINTTDVTDPWGGNIADKVLETTTANVNHELRPPPYTHIPGQSYVFSAWIRGIGRNYFTFFFAGSNFPANVLVNVNLATGTVVSQGAGATGSGIITGTGTAAGWYRVWVAGTSVATPANDRAGITVLSDTNTTPYTGDATKGYYIAGAQIHPGTAPIDVVQSGLVFHTNPSNYVVSGNLSLALTPAEHIDARAYASQTAIYATRLLINVQKTGGPAINPYHKQFRSVFY